MSSRQLIYASFAHEKDLLEGVRALRRAGVKILDAFTPYAVHGLDRALGLRPSPLTWVCFLCAMTGATFALWFEHWSLAIDWPLNVGGKPWNSLPSDVPIGFELAVLFGGFGSVFALFGVCRLYPGKRARLVAPRVTEDRFVVVIEETDAVTTPDFVHALLEPHGVVELEERLAEEKQPW